MTGVIFDMDMVLCKSRPALFAAITEYFRRRGADVDFLDFRPFMGRNEKHYIKHTCEKNGLEFDPGFAGELMDIYEGFSELVKAMPFAAECVRTLRGSGHPVALASSADLRKARINMRVLGLDLDEDFDFYVTGDMVKEAKPNPEVFLCAAAGLGVDPARCLVIEDSESGLQAALGAGMKACAITSVHPAEELERSRPDYIIDSLSQVPGIAAGMSEK